MINGITPACAGKRMIIVSVGETHRDHPRVCGEKSGPCFAPPPRRGSPPRVRGKGMGWREQKRRNGITPACAGKSGSCILLHLLFWDHPRVCGEKPDVLLSLVFARGSPPRVRGKAALKVRIFRPVGITPACAGKRLKRSHSIGHFSCILCLFHSVLHRASVSGGSRAGPCAPPCLPAQNAVPV